MPAMTAVVPPSGACAVVVEENEKFTSWPPCVLNCHVPLVTSKPAPDADIVPKPLAVIKPPAFEKRAQDARLNVIVPAAPPELTTQKAGRAPELKDQFAAPAILTEVPLVIEPSVVPFGNGFTTATPEKLTTLVANETVALSRVAPPLKSIEPVISAA